MRIDKIFKYIIMLITHHKVIALSKIGRAERLRAIGEAERAG